MSKVQETAHRMLIDGFILTAMLSTVVLVKATLPVIQNVGSLVGHVDTNIVLQIDVDRVFRTFDEVNSIFRELRTNDHVEGSAVEQITGIIGEVHFILSQISGSNLSVAPDTRERSMQGIGGVVTELVELLRQLNGKGGTIDSGIASHVVNIAGRVDAILAQINSQLFRIRSAERAEIISVIRNMNEFYHNNDSDRYSDSEALIYRFLNDSVLVSLDTHTDRPGVQGLVYSTDFYTNRSVYDSLIHSVNRCRVFLEREDDYKSSHTDEFRECYGELNQAICVFMGSALCTEAGKYPPVMSIADNAADLVAAIKERGAARVGAFGSYPRQDMNPLTMSHVPN